MKSIFTIIVLLLLAGCGQEAAMSERKENPVKFTGYQLAEQADGRLDKFFSCIRERGLTLIVAHRGGPDNRFPENGLITLENVVKNLPAMVEVDIRQTKDGVLFLQHDVELDRSTTGKGKVTELDWATIAQLKLRTESGEISDSSPVTLAQLLDWSENRALLYLDVKPPTDVRDVYRLVSERGALGRVAYIAYTREDAEWLLAQNAGIQVAVGLSDSDQLIELERKGWPLNQVHALTNAEAVKFDFFQLLTSSNVTVTMLTGGAPERIDYQVEKTGNNQPYLDVAKAPVQVVFTDRPFTAAKAIYNDGGEGLLSCLPDVGKVR